MWTRASAVPVRPLLSVSCEVEYLAMVELELRCSLQCCRYMLRRVKAGVNNQALNVAYYIRSIV